MGTLRFSPCYRPETRPRSSSRRQPYRLARQDEEDPGQALSPEHLDFLEARFRRLDAERAAPGHRGRYAVVRRGITELGVVAVDADLGVWFTALGGCCSHLEDGENGEDGEQNVRRIQRELAGQGFRYSSGGILGVLYFDLVYRNHAALPGPSRPWQLAPGGGARPAALAGVAGLKEPVGADREDGRQAHDGGGPGAAAVGRGVEVA